MGDRMGASTETATTGEGSGAPVSRSPIPDPRSSSAPAARTHDRILILDFGSQVTQLIARRLRESHVYCEIHPCDVSDAFVQSFAPQGIVLSGGNVDLDALPWQAMA